MNLLKKIFPRKQTNQSLKKEKQIKYLTLNGFEMRMTNKGFEQFQKDNKKTLKHWSGLWDEIRTPYFKFKIFKEFVVVYVGKDFEDCSLRKYVEENYDNLVFELS